MAWARVQSKSGTSATATTFTVTLGSTPTVGNKILVYADWGLGAFTSMKDGNGNSLTAALTPVVQASHGTRGVWFYDVPATPSTAFTVIIGTGSDIGMLVQEVSGLAAGNTTAAAVDGTPGSISGTASPTGSATYSSTALNEFLTSFYGDDGLGATVTPPGGYTADANNVNTSSLENCLVAYKNSTSGAEAASWSFTGSAGFTVITLAFKLATTVAARPVSTTVTAAARNRASNW